MSKIYSFEEFLLYARKSYSLEGMDKKQLSELGRYQLIRLISEAEKAYKNNETSKLYHPTSRDDDKSKKELIEAIRQLKDVKPTDYENEKDGYAVVYANGKFAKVTGHFIVLHFDKNYKYKFVEVNG